MKLALFFVSGILCFLVGCRVAPVLEPKPDYSKFNQDVFSTHKLTHDLNRFAMIETHALNTPESAETNLDRLSSYLIQPCRNDSEKARVIFAWICNNIEYATWSVGHSLPSSPDSILKSRSSVCSGYSRLFDALCEKAGVESVTIEGFAKGIGYRPGDPVSHHGNHAWNAVKINGEWKLLDCTWGSGYINSKGQFVKRLDDYFFFTNPEQLILTHLPENPYWQLLDLPVDKYTFAETLFPKSAYFREGIMAVSPGKSVVSTTKKQVTLKFKVPEGIDILASVKTNSGSPIKIRPEKRIRENVQFNVKMNHSGNYYVDIYTGESGDILELTLHYLIVRQEP